MQLDPNLLLLLSDRLRRNVGMNGQAQMTQTTGGRGLDPNLALMMQAMNGGQHYDTQGRLMLPNAGPQGSALDNQEFSRLDAYKANQPQAGSRYAQATFATGPRDRAAASVGPIMDITSRAGNLSGGEQGPTQFREERMPMQDLTPKPTVQPRPAYGAGPWRPNAPAPVAPNFGVPQMPKPANTDSVYARWPKPQGYSPESWREFNQQQAAEKQWSNFGIEQQYAAKLASLPKPDYAGFQQGLQRNIESDKSYDLFDRMFMPRDTVSPALLQRSIQGAGQDFTLPTAVARDNMFRERRAGEQELVKAIRARMKQRQMNGGMF